MTGSLGKVNWLTIREVAQLWAPQLNLPVSVIERELRIALYKMEINYPYEQPIDVDPSTVDLPSPDALIERDFIERFHEKEEWKLPNFWFAVEQPEGPSFSGRPSVMNAIIAEMDSRKKAGLIESTLAEEARALAKWAKEQFPRAQTPTAKSIENGVRVVYRSLQGKAPQAH